MDFKLTEEQQMLQDTAARLVRAAGAPDTPARWDGSLVLALPAE